MARFRKKPQTFVAEQYDGSTTHHLMCEGVCRWGKGNCPTGAHVHTTHDGQAVEIEAGDWIVAEPNGDGYYPIKPQVMLLIADRIADPDCLSCHGTGHAVVRRDGITYASGTCRCMGGDVFANA